VESGAAKTPFNDKVVSGCRENWSSRRRERGRPGDVNKNEKEREKKQPLWKKKLAQPREKRVSRKESPKKLSDRTGGTHLHK
jgi:hypothetical protein